MNYYSKYKSKKTIVDGIKFDSKLESNIYLKLKEYKSKFKANNDLILEKTKSGVIENIKNNTKELSINVPNHIWNMAVELQPKYELQEKFKFNGKSIRAIDYTADFKITLLHSYLVTTELKPFQPPLYNTDQYEYIVDAKGMETEVFKIKKKMFIKKYNKDVVIVKSVKQFTQWMDGIIKDLIKEEEINE